MTHIKVTGMTCAACQARVEKAVRKVPGVQNCAVNLLTGDMRVDGSAAEQEIIAAVSAAGYGAAPASDTVVPESDTQIKEIKKRLTVSLVFLVFLMYLSMGHTMFGFPLPTVLDTPSVLAIMQMLLSAVIIVLNRKFFISGGKGILHGAPNMDTLVSLGSSASFVWSIYILILLIRAQASGDAAKAQELLHGLYFESAAMILVLITVGKLLEAYSKGKTTTALRSLMELTPKTATLWRDGNEVTVPVDAVRPGDRFVVRPGESIPADGIIIEGSTAVNESALTGESIPVDKMPGDAVSAATVNQAGYIRCTATRVGQDTTLSQIIKLVADTAATKAPIAKIADTVSGIFVPVVIGIAFITLVVWRLIGQPTDVALTHAISVLVISCPCALGLATPVAIMVGSGVGAKHGLLFKTAAALEQTGKVQFAVLDKTGTVTVGAPTVTGVYPADGVTERELMSLALSLEQKSEHPLAAAIVAAAKEQNITAGEVTDFAAVPGAGLSAVIDGETLYGGNRKFISSVLALPPEILENAKVLAEHGNTPLYFAKERRFLGLIAVADTVKDDSFTAVEQLKSMGLSVILLTGDNARTANAVAQKIGIDYVISDVLPEQKQQVIRRLSALGKVMMVGDGINDAPALTAADIGIAIGAATDIAVDAADVVVMRRDLTDIPSAVRLSRAVFRNIRQNLFWAFFYNALCIPLAAGCFTGLLGWSLSPMVAAAAMSLSSVCVVTNALRLNLCSVNIPKKDHVRSGISESQILSVINAFQKEETVMKKTILIEGMMCPHCEAHTVQALEAVDGVASATASHLDGTAIVTLTKDIDDAVLSAAVNAAGYTVTGIR